LSSKESLEEIKKKGEKAQQLLEKRREIINNVKK